MKDHTPAVVLSATVLVIALVHVLEVFKLDNVALALIGIAAAPWLLPFLKSLTLPGGTVIQFQERLDEVEKQLQLVEATSQLPGKSVNGAALGEAAAGRAPVSAAPALEEAGGALAPSDPDDPHKGQFGGSPLNQGYLLEAKLEPRAGPRSSACWVALSVRSVDPAKPLKEEVIVHLHPTFGRWKRYALKPKNGIASDTLTSWGAFTIGVLVGKNQIPLELDLTTVPGGTKKFYEE